MIEDTSPKALEVYLRLHRALTPAQRLARAIELCDFQAVLQESNVRPGGYNSFWG